MRKCLDFSSMMSFELTKRSLEPIQSYGQTSNMFHFWITRQLFSGALHLLATQYIDFYGVDLYNLCCGYWENSDYTRISVYESREKWGALCVRNECEQPWRILVYWHRRSMEWRKIKLFWSWAFHGKEIKAHIENDAWHIESSRGMDFPILMLQCSCIPEHESI